MRLILAVLAAASLAGCAGSRYTRHEDGWWTESRPRAEVRFSVGYGWGYAGSCSPWTGPWGWYPSAHSPWHACSAFGYGGYWGSPGYGPYPYGWYLPPRSIEGPRAGARARGLAATPEAAPMFPRYEDLAPQRRRDTGGERAWGMRSQWPSAPSASSSHGLGSAAGRGSGLSGSTRSSQGGFGAGSSARSAPAARDAGGIREQER